MELREKLLSASDTELTEARVVNREKVATFTTDDFLSH